MWIVKNRNLVGNDVVFFFIKGEKIGGLRFFNVNYTRARLTCLVETKKEITRQNVKNKTQKRKQGGGGVQKTSILRHDRNNISQSNHHNII